MLDNLYKNIGGKIKNWAKWMFIVEAIGAIITGLVFLFEEAERDEIFILYGLLTMVVGPIVAWVGSWILYAFGELVEDVHAMRNKEIPTTVNTTAMPSTTPTYTAKSPVVTTAPPAPAIQPGAVTGQVYKKSTNDPNRQNTPVSAVVQGDQKVCPKCGTAQRHDRRICWFCGQHFDN